MRERATQCVGGVVSGSPGASDLSAKMCAKTHFGSRPCRARPTFLFKVSLVQGPRGQLGLVSGAENPESNEQGAGPRQRTARSARGRVRFKKYDYALRNR